MNRAGLERAYRDTTYVVDHPDGAIGIRIGEPCARLDALLAAQGITRWAFVTAWNPRSEQISNKNNELRNSALREAVARSGHACLTGRGVPDRGDWPAEESFLIPGLDVAAALALGRRFGQHAIVAGSAGECAVLHWCDGGDDDRMPG